MEFVVERGDPSRPRGHALLYFRDREQTAKVYVTYVVVLPVALDLVKYMPPFLAPQMAGVEARELAAFPFPPIPEAMESYEYLAAVAEARQDDLLFGGTASEAELPNLLAPIFEAAQRYGAAYQQAIAEVPQGQPVQEELSGPGVSEVLYPLMTEQDRLGELAKLLGRLRFAAEGGDTKAVQEIEQEITILGRYLPPQYSVPRLVRAAMDLTARGAELAQLYLERCYRLQQGDTAGLERVEGRIMALHGELP